tara:strand:- start:2829 stop:3371 length:543 start_codon:yes stop_codon:yes gene_type:complete
LKDYVGDFASITMPVLIIFLIANLFLNKGFGIEFFKQEQKYVAFSARKTNATGTYTDFDVDIDRYGEKKVEYERSYYIDKIIKKNIVNKNTTEYKNTKRLLNESNFYVGEREYKFWETAVVDGYDYTKTKNSFKLGWYYFLELCYATIPNVIYCIILHVIMILIILFRYYVLGLYTNTDL